VRSLSPRTGALSLRFVIVASPLALYSPLALSFSYRRIVIQEETERMSVGAQDVLEIMKTLAERNEDLNSRGSELTRT